MALTRYNNEFSTQQWLIKDFPEEGAPTLLLKFPENCMKLKKIRPPVGGGDVPYDP